MTEDNQADRTAEAIHTRNALSMERILKEPSGGFMGWSDYRVLAIRLLDALDIPADTVLADSIEVGDEELTYRRFLERGELLEPGTKIYGDSDQRAVVVGTAPIPPEHRELADQVRMWFITPKGPIHGGHYLKLTLEQWGGVTGSIECREPAGSICNQWCAENEMHEHEHTGDILDNCPVEAVPCMAKVWWDRDTSAAMEGYYGDDTEARSGIIEITQWGEDGIEWRYAEAK